MKTAVRMFCVGLMIGLVFGCGDKKAGIQGKVIDGNGQPMSGVKVVAKQVQPIKGYEQFETTTGSDGIFRFKGLFPASEYSVFPSSDKWKTSVKVAVQSAPEGQTSIVQSPLAIRFLVSDQGIITDTKTKLQWLPAKKIINWRKATNYVEGLSVGGGGWRLPTRSELRAIYGAHRDPVFNGPHWAWTSEAINDTAWYFDFSSGRESYPGQKYVGAATHALPVRLLK